MNVLTLALLMSSAAAGGIINTVCGFGLGAVAMSVWPYLMPYMQSVSVVTLCGLTIDLLLLSNTYRFISWKKLVPCLICGMIFSSLSVYLSVGAAEKALTRSLGVILIALGVYSVFFSGRIRIKASPFNGCIAGALAQRHHHGAGAAGLAAAGRRRRAEHSRRQQSLPQTRRGEAAQNSLRLPDLLRRAAALPLSSERRRGPPRGKRPLFFSRLKRRAGKRKVDTFPH
ncbi:sulfite exporter TauE/SafE family protein [Pyramidobacter sp. YE332]|uniref:sulfite exporter TauE/SafE family protein n=1 Tax=Pyramidobacter sp. YE332 TaxID=3068894 RepID=UPI00294AA78E|nr:sulfite exporter TauE/SafE family protein [Pyramidobacter sp. YE332]WOL40483.1 sulfite exporter TauE/SafE family protein [Pyramidobacter sp. YE332]